MAKIIITSKENAKIHGITRPVEGNRFFFCKELNSGNFVATYKGEDRSFPIGLNALLYDGNTVRPYLIQYRSVWGVSNTHITVDDKIVSKTPQTTHKGTFILFNNGSDALEDGGALAGKSLILEKAYNGTFTSKKGNTYNWDLLGMGISDDSYTVKSSKLTIDGKTFSISELQKQFDELEAVQSKRVEDL